MGLTRTHSFASAICCVLACLLLVHARSQDDVSSTANFRNDAGSSVPAVADRSSNLKSAWWQAPLQIQWLQEVVIVTLLSIYLSNIWYGRARNAEIAIAFADTFCTEGSLLERNFSQVGARINGAMDLILRESMNKFNIYATGRRYCKSFQATLDLQHRQDLIYMACYLVSPRQDHIDIDIPMNEANMQPLVLVIAAPRLAKELSKSLPDVQSFARPIPVEAKRLPQFPSDKLAVWAESSSTFYDLMTDKVTDLLFGRAAFEEASKYFRYLHFSSENPEGFSKHSLKLSFNLPPKEQMQDLTKVLTAVLHFIDVVGSHQLGPEAKEKALKRREKVAATEHKSSASERAEAQQQKRFEKQQEQMEKVKRMAPEQRAKFEARQERVQTKRAMNKRMIRA